MKKQIIIYAFAGIAVILLAAGWYGYMYHSCIGQISYVPPREGRTASIRETGGLYTTSIDKGDYYTFGFQKYKTFDDAMRACIWK